MQIPKLLLVIDDLYTSNRFEFHELLHWSRERSRSMTWFVGTRCGGARCDAARANEKDKRTFSSVQNE
jgi:hypothetical protein